MKRSGPIKRRTPLKRGKPPSRRPKTERQKLDAEALKLWAAIVKRRDGQCMVREAKRCTPHQWPNAHHVIPRERKGTRYEIENGLTACRACHVWLHEVCLDVPSWYRAHGIDFEFLRDRAELGGKGLDLKLVILDLKAMGHIQAV